jgi:hypothetical protein
VPDEFVSEVFVLVVRFFASVGLLCGFGLEVLLLFVLDVEESILIEVEVDVSFEDLSLGGETESAELMGFGGDVESIELDLGGDEESTEVSLGGETESTELLGLGGEDEEKTEERIELCLGGEAVREPGRRGGEEESPVEEEEVVDTKLQTTRGSENGSGGQDREIELDVLDECEVCDVEESVYFKSPKDRFF